MIIDDLKNFRNYVQLHPLFEQVADLLESHDLTLLQVGKSELKGQDLWVNVQDARTCWKEDAVLETHRKYIDIQIPISSEETFGFTPLSRLPEEKHDDENDITKYGSITAESYITLQPGQFAIFFPQDGHAPCISNTIPTIRKAVFKVRIFSES